jgi:sensor histidine kinase YesM
MESVATTEKQFGLHSLFIPHVSSHEENSSMNSIPRGVALKMQLSQYTVYVSHITRCFFSPPPPPLAICIQCSLKSHTLVCIATLLIVIQFRHTPFRGVSTSLQFFIFWKQFLCDEVFFILFSEKLLN